MTPQEVAQHINKLKPDFKPFWESVKNSDYYAVYVPDPDPAVTLFQVELLRIYYTVHSQKYLSIPLRESVASAVNQIPYTGQTNFHWRTNYNIIHKSGDYSNLILAYVTNVKQYLNPYLRKKLGFTGTTSKQIKSLNADMFSVELFKNSLGKRQIPSTEAIAYFNQFKNFSPTIRDAYLEIILAHCKTPSVAFQRAIEDSGEFSISSQPEGAKFINLRRYDVKNRLPGITNKTPMTNHLFNDRDSDYVPFTCGIPRKPTPSEHEVSAMVSMLFTVASSTVANRDYIVECLHNHLSDPEYGTLYTDYLANLKNYAHSILDLTKEV